ncbi:hypothetical protein OAF99_00425 [Akkermansiaceae bacterium]|nr:hypothetical protein [Rhodopirellula sp.]MDB4623849.1 hypothetical protein [Akkermansiaceae bacterium]MDB4758785.1 hypothetical protein [Akkermansiaceae bacterium]
MTKIEHQKSRSDKKSLTWIVTKASLISVALGMTGYSVFEFIASGEIDGGEFATHHLLPVFIIGLVVWLALHWLLQAKLVSPIQEINEHLYHLGLGRLAPLQLVSDVREVESIVEGVNSLTSQLKKAPESDASSKAVDDLVDLRGKLKEVIDSEVIKADSLVPIMQDLTKLEGHLLSALESQRQN